jgi:hypothetical protein
MVYVITIIKKKVIWIYNLIDNDETGAREPTTSITKYDLE